MGCIFQGVKLSFRINVKHHLLLARRFPRFDNFITPQNISTTIILKTSFVVNKKTWHSALALAYSALMFYVHHHQIWVRQESNKTQIWQRWVGSWKQTKEHGWNGSLLNVYSLWTIYFFSNYELLGNKLRSPKIVVLNE